MGLAMAWTAKGRVSVATAGMAATAEAEGGSLRLGLRAGPTVVVVGTAPSLAFAAATVAKAGRGALLLLNAGAFCQNNEARNRRQQTRRVCAASWRPRVSEARAGCLATRMESCGTGRPS